MYGEEEYRPVRPKDYEDGSAEDLESTQDSPEPLWKSSKFRTRLLWILLGISVVLNTFHFLRDLGILGAHEAEEDTFQGGFLTDFKPARPAIKTHQVMFEGSPWFYENGTMYYPGPREQPLYIGEPSEEIDNNWEALTKERYWAMSEAEAIEALGVAEYHTYWDPKTQGYIAGFDSQHTLHCLNFLRKSFYPEYYSEMSAVHGVVHRDHCIDHLRQLVQCHVDLTPIPTRFRPGFGRNYIDSDRWHTCRDWSSVMEWVGKRFAESQVVIAEQTNGEVNYVHGSGLI